MTSSVKHVAIIGNPKALSAFSNRRMPPLKVAMSATADIRAERNRAAGLELVRGGPDPTISVLRRFRHAGNLALSLFPETEILPERVPHLQLPHHHELRASDVVLKR